MDKVGCPPPLLSPLPVIQTSHVWMVKEEVCPSKGTTQ